MKTTAKILISLFLLITISCVEEGEPGPQGIPGRNGTDGKDGESFLGTIFDIEGDFNPDNEFLLRFNFPKEIYNTDVVLVYILWNQTEDEFGEPLDIWRLLPQNTVLDNGDVLQYNFDYTALDVSIFLEGNLNSVPNEYALDQVFRIVVFPADYMAKKNLDINDYNLMMKSIKQDSDKIKFIDIKSTPLINNISN